MSSRWLLVLSSVVFAACAERSPVAPVSLSSHPAAQVRAECKSVARGNFVLEWSDYVERETTFGGKPMKLFSPTPGAHRLVRDADVTPRNTKFGVSAVLGMGTIGSIFDWTNASLTAGEIVEREVPGDQLAELCVTGTHARAYWTHPHKKVRTEAGQTVQETFSTIYIEGTSAGEGTLTLRLPDGTSRTTTFTITPASSE